MHKGLLVFSILVLLGCKQNQTASNQISLRDSIIKIHLKNVESSEFYDTTDYDFKMLKAYFNNDSAYFVKLKKDMEYNPEDLIPRLDSSIQQKKLSDLEVEKAYRFKHGQSFCPWYQNITITRTKDSVQLYFIEYSNGQGHSIKLTNGTELNPYCTITKEFNKPLTLEQWDQIERKIYQADYWGLKPNNYSMTLDGSWWEVQAYTNEPKGEENLQFHHVSRANPNSLFKEIGIYLMNLSGEKSKCGELR